MARPTGTKNIKTPEILWQHFIDYKEWVEKNPLKKEDYVGKDANRVFREIQRPLTFEGFELFCYENDIINDLSDYFSNRDNRYEDYTSICSRIKKTIRNDHIQGGMAGIYNPSITQRLNNIVEKTETKVEITQDKLSEFKMPDFIEKVKK